MDNPHIVQIIPTLRYGGAERIVINLANGLVEVGYRCSIITFFDDMPLADELHPDVEVHVVQKHGTLSFGLISDLARKLKEVRADIVHTHLFGADVWGRIAAKKCGLPVVTTEQNINKDEGFIKHVVKRTLRGKTDRYVALSSTVRTYMQSAYGIVEDIVVIHPGIEIEQFQHISAALFETPLQLLMIGRLERQKGFDIGLRALAAFTDHEWHCSIVGSGSEETTLKKLVSSLGLEDHITLVPASGDVVSAYEQADVVIMPSRWEGFGIVAMEAMAARRLLIGTRVGGLGDIVEDKTTGILVPPGDKNKLSEALAWVFSHPDNAKNIAKNAQSSAKEFDVAGMVDAYTSIYKELI